MKVVIFKNLVEVSNKLAERGTSRELMMAVLDAMVAAKNECTDNDPAGSRGWRAWQMGTRRNREVHVGISDWQKDDTDQISSIVSKKLGLRIVICNTDDGTCMDAGEPQNCSKKGVGNEKAIDGNQISLFPDAELPAARKTSGDNIVVLKAARTSVGPVTTLYFCAHIQGDEVRAELSCPVSFEGGFFGKFVERIYIVGGDTPQDGSAKQAPSRDDGSEYDIPVKLKKRD